jgi:hypothetical protein
MKSMKKEAWVTAKEAAEIISANSGRPIIQQYVRELAQKGKIAYKQLDGRTNIYLRTDVEKIKVRIKKVADRQKSTSAVPTEQERPIEQAQTSKQEERQWWESPEQKEESKTEESQPDAA